MIHTNYSFFKTDRVILSYEWLFLLKIQSSIGMILPDHFTIKYERRHWANANCVARHGAERTRHYGVAGGAEFVRGGAGMKDRLERRIVWAQHKTPD
jgi:hypothetical protein